jgi:hypothetical protein
MAAGTRNYPNKHAHRDGHTYARRGGTANYTNTQAHRDDKRMAVVLTIADKQFP